MTTRHLIDPDLAPGLDFFPPFEIDLAALPEIRDAFASGLPPVETYQHPDVKIETRSIPGLNGAPDVEAIFYWPKATNTPLPAFLNIHGGGYMFGTAADNGPANIRTAAEVGCLVVSPEYRLAPETPAPGGVEDCYAVLLWLHRNADELGLDRARFAVGGMSAGGGLAAALALLARDMGEIALCFQQLIYPMLDDRTVMRNAADENPVTGEFVWTRTDNRIGWTAQLGHAPGAKEASYLAAPARATDLTGLPPAYITVGMLDLFLEEDIDYANRLMKAAVPTELHVVPGAYHGFELAAEAPLAQRSESDRRRALANAFARAGQQTA